MRKKRNTFLMVIIVLLFLVGFGLTVYPYVRGAIVDRVIEFEAEDFLTRIDEEAGETTEPVISFVKPTETPATEPREYAQLWEEMQTYNETIYAEGQAGLSGANAYEQASFTLTDYGLEDEIFGVISIPALELEMPIYLGATKQNMAAGAAHMSQTSLPIGGENTNTVIAGHRGWNGAAYFLYINQLEIGDVVTITNLWETLTYEVVETKIITPYNVEAIHIQEGRELLTLLTCHPPATGGRERYLVFCERVK